MDFPATGFPVNREPWLACSQQAAVGGAGCGGRVGCCSEFLLAASPERRGHRCSPQQLPVFFYRYFLLCVNYFFYGETVTDYFFTLVQREEPLRILSKYHRFISFTLYLIGRHSAVHQFLGLSCLCLLSRGWGTSWCLHSLDDVKLDGARLQS